MRFWIPFVVLALAGCDATTFASANAALKSTKQAATQANNVPLPAAAIAASLGAVELVKALSTTSQASLVGTTAANRYALAAVNAGDQDVVNEDAKVKMHLRYTSTTAADGSVTAEVSSFTGTAQGYQIDAHGSFRFDPAGQVSCSMAGAIGYDATSFTVKELSVNTTFPLPTANAELGSCVFQQLDGTTVKAQLDAKLAVNASGAIVASGDLTKDGITTPLTNFGQL